MSEKGKTEALFAAADLPLNETIYSDCPSCGGQMKFSVTRSREGVLWNCFKADCPEKGFEVTLGQLTPPAKRSTKLRPWTHKLNALSGRWRQWLMRRFDVDPEIVDTIRITEQLRFALPILDPRGWERGWVIRQPWGMEDAGPKALTRMHQPGPTQSWHRPTTQPLSDCVVLVEDQMSAMVVATGGFTAVALLGTQLDNDKVREIAMERPSEVIIALDADATAQAFKLARKWGLAFRKTRVAVLEHDLKDDYADDVREILGL